MSCDWSGLPPSTDTPIPIETSKHRVFSGMNIDVERGRVSSSIEKSQPSLLVPTKRVERLFNNEAQRSDGALTELST
jgi:hypothetical protein